VCYLAASAIIVIIIFVTLCTLLGFFFLFCLFCLVFVYIVLYYCMLPLEVNKVVQCNLDVSMFSLVWVMYRILLSVCTVRDHVVMNRQLSKTKPLRCRQLVIGRNHKWTGGYALFGVPWQLWCKLQQRARAYVTVRFC